MNIKKNNYYKELETEDKIVFFRVDDHGRFTGANIVLDKNCEAFETQLSNINVLMPAGY